MCDQCQRQHEAERRMWLAIRRGLLAVAKAIETRYREEPAHQDKRAA